MEKYFEVGQTVYDVRFGQGEVYKIDSGTNDYPIRVGFISGIEKYTTDGKYSVCSVNISLFQTAPIITPNVPIIEFTHLELVLVRDLYDWAVRYYSHFENGKHYCFSNQKTEGDSNYWSKIMKITNNTILPPN